MVDLFDGIDFGDGSTTSTLDKSDDLFGGIDFTTSDLPAAADAGVPPSPAPSVDPIIEAASGGRNNARVAPQLPVVSNETPDFDSQIARNNELAARVDGLLAGTPDLSGRNDTRRFNTLAPEVGQDGVNPVSVFNPDPTQAARDQIVAGANAQLGPTQLKADLGLYEPDRSFGTAFEYGGLRSRGQVTDYAADLEGRLRRSGVNRFLQSVQNATLPVVNPIRETLGLQSLPQDANMRASEASEAAKRNSAQRLFAQAEALGFKPMTTDEIEGFGDFLTWAKTSLASSGEPMLIALATGGWMSPVLMAGEYNASLKEIEGLSEDKRLALATGGGVLAGFLENIGLGLLVKGMPKELVGALGGKYFADFIGKNYGTRIGTAVLSGMAAEGITEAGQEGIGITLESIAGKEFGKGEIGKRLWEALAAGGVVGAPIRGSVQAGTEVAGALKPDPLLTDADKAQAQFAAIALQSPDNAQMAQVAEQDVETSLLAVRPDRMAFDFRPNIEPAPVSAAETTTEVAPPTTEVAAVEPTPEPAVEPAVEPTVEPEPEVDIDAAIERLRQDYFRSLNFPDGSPQAEPTAVQPVDFDPTLDGYARANPDPNDPIPNSVIDMIAWVTTPEKAKQLTNKDISLVMRSGTSGGAPPGNLEFIFAERAARQAALSAAEPDNPQAKPVIPFARPVSDADGQQKTVSIATPDNEVTVQAKPVILDAADLKAATGNLQPRDRSLDESAVEVQRRAANLDPARLLDSPTSDSGAPIVARDGTIISGNGRVLSLRAVYDQFPEQAAAYKQAIADYGTSDQNYDNPVLVMMIDQDMSFDQLSDFADRSNRSAIATMSATERAQRDAKAMDIEMVNLFQGGSMTAIENQGFVQQFMRGVVAPTEQNTMSRDGQLTKEGVQRMQNAILATAYEDTDALAIMLDSTDDNIKAISNAMLDAAPSFAKLKSDIAAGEVNSQFDISSKVTEAARKISDLRNRGIKPRDFFAQQDAFNQIDPDVEALIRAFYNEELTRAKSQRIMSDVLKFYTEEAAQKKQDGFFEDTTTPRDVIELARRKADGTEGQGDLLSDAQQRPSRSLNESGQQTQRAAPTRSRQESGSQRSREATQARRQRQAELKDEAARPSRAEVASEETVGAPENTVLPISELSNQRTQKPGTLVDREAMRKGSALQFQAFADAGVDPNRAINFPIERQFKILSDMMVERFGFAQVIKSEEANSKEAVDQLLVGYHNLTNLAANLGLPTKAFGLEGTLSFALAKNIGAYGVYNPNNRAITLPKRSNSFAHEWFHALDHYLLDKYGSGENTRLPLASEAVRKHGTEAFGPDAPTSVQDSYFALMRALFKDKASEALQLQSINQKMAEIEARAAKAGKAVSEIKAYQKLEAQKKNILGSIGKSQKIGKTQMRKDAEFFAEITKSGAKYWTMPAEMAARAFEAFAVTQVTNAGLQTGFLGKSVEAYEMTLEQLGVSRDQLQNPRSMADIAKIMDSRLALTFPKNQERVEIFGAYRNLIDAIARETVLGEGKAATEVGSDFVLDVRKMHDVPEDVSQGIIADQKREIRNAQNFAEKKKSQPKTYGDRFKGKKVFKYVPAMPFYYVEDSFFAPFFYQKQGQLKAILKRYPSNRSMRVIYNNLGTQTAGSFQSTREGGNLLDAQARQIRVFSDRLKNVMNEHDVAGFNELETDQLHTILTSQDDLGSAPDNVVKAAGGFRAIYNMMYDYARKAELDIGYAPSGYVPRVLDHMQVSADGKKFKRQAAKVYRIVYDEALGPVETDLDYMLKTLQFIRDQRLSIEELNQQTSRRRSLATEPEYLSFTQGSKWRRVREAKSQLDALQKAKKKAPNLVEQGAIDEAQSELDSAVLAAGADFERFHGDMRNLFAKFSAFNWHMKVQQSHVGDPTDASPQAKFGKKRQLPPQADALMEQFYVSDPVEAITNYILSVVRKAEYNRRFGAHLLPNIASKNDYSDFLDYLLKKLEDNMSMVEANEVKTTVNNILGRNMEGFLPGMAQKLANRGAAVLSITLLVRAPIASIAEPMTVAMTTGSVSKGLRSFGATMMEFPGLRKLSKNAAEDIRLRHQFARILGVIDDPEVGDIMTSRIGGEFAGDPNINRLQSKFFAKIKLSGITNAQRRSASKIGFQYIVEMAHEVRNPSSEKNKARAELVLKDLGVHKSRLDQFVDFVLDYSETKAGLFGKQKVKATSLPEAEAIMDDSGDFTDMGLQLSVSVMRFVDQTIQDPRTTDRPRWAESGVGRIIYGITSFIYSFQDKVLKAMGRKFKREYGISRNLGKGKAAAAGDAASWAFLNSAIPLMSLFAAHAVVSTAREYIFNQDRWDREWEESEEDPAKFATNYLLPLAFTRAGLTGAFDPIVQAFTGLKYQRDIANSFLGIGSYVAQNVGDVAQVFSSSNSPNTVSSEFKFLRGLYNLIVQPAVSLALASLPLTPTTAIPATGAAMGVTSTSFKNEFINMVLELIYGQRYEPGQRGRTRKKRPGDK